MYMCMNIIKRLHFEVADHVGIRLKQFKDIKRSAVQKRLGINRKSLCLLEKHQDTKPQIERGVWRKFASAVAKPQIIILILLLP